jgi:transposase
MRRTDRRNSRLKLLYETLDGVLYLLREVHGYRHLPLIRQGTICRRVVQERFDEIEAFVIEHSESPYLQCAVDQTGDDLERHAGIVYFA